MYRNFFKGILDIVIAVIAVIVLLPILLLLMVLIKFTSKGSAFYIQKRLGKNAKVFNLIKFRSMYTNSERDVNIQVHQHSSLITPIGKFMRRYKIDELAQLFNVLKGDMSIIGPRPCLIDLKKEFNDDGWERIKVKPGLTGLAQINGNIFLSWKERWAYDRHYVKNLSFLLDMKIIIKTFLIIINGEERYKSEINQ